MRQSDIEAILAALTSIGVILTGILSKPYIVSLATFLINRLIKPARDNSANGETIAALLKTMNSIQKECQETKNKLQEEINGLKESLQQLKIDNVRLSTELQSIQKKRSTDELKKVGS